MSDVKEAARDLVEALKTQRDELRVQIDLASAEARERIGEEWSELEGKFADLKAEMGRINQHLEDAAGRTGDDLREFRDEIEGAGRRLAKDLRERYELLREQLKK